MSGCAVWPVLDSLARSASAVLRQRCCGCRLHDTVGVEGAAATGAVKIALAFANGQAAGATFALPLSAKAGR
jgi:hypothetical protein